MIRTVAIRQKETEEVESRVSAIRENKILGKIVEERVDWNDIFQTIQDITNATFPGNTISRRVTYMSYGGKSGKDKRIDLQGQIRSADGRSWEGLITLKNALNNHENFKGVTISQFVKQHASAGSKVTGQEYVTPFNFTFTYYPDGKEEQSSSEETS